MRESEPKIIELLRVLHECQVDFIIVGGVCAVLHGAPITTFDLDLVHCQKPENLNRLMNALIDLDAHYRGHVKKIRPDVQNLASNGHHLLITRLGPLDLLGTVENGKGYVDLIGHSESIQIENLTFRILSLQYLIETKKASKRDKDLLKLRILKHTLIEREKNKT